MNPCQKAGALVLRMVGGVLAVGGAVGLLGGLLLVAVAKPLGRLVGRGLG